jgi:hypothetical protein
MQTALARSASHREVTEGDPVGMLEKFGGKRLPQRGSSLLLLITLLSLLLLLWENSSCLFTKPHPMPQDRGHQVWPYPEPQAGMLKLGME